ncbi:hypothetical protein M513_09898 [Trichuris suis]|uniref:Uncharacterized protein n=1 Tax=Trichuris suis TaxID=68888 RepID=A0A085LWA1_9BILA|nr:hypothetical protein M513_09898 [Trichuris suis]
MERQYEDADANSPGHPGLNWEPLDLQSNALPLSYTPYGFLLEQLNLRTSMKHDDKQSSFLAVKKASIDLRDVSSINTMSCIDNSLPSKWNTFSEVALSIFTVIYAEDRTVLFHAGSTGQFVYFLNCSFVFTVKLYPLKDYVSQKSQTR